MNKQENVQCGQCGKSLNYMDAIITIGSSGGNDEIHICQKCFGVAEGECFYEHIDTISRVEEKLEHFDFISEYCRRTSPVNIPTDLIGCGKDKI